MENRRCLLKMVDVAKSFPGVKALDGVNFSLEKGEIHALVGENGAGKTTLMNVLGGVLKPDSGQIFIEGKETDISNPLVARELGIAFIHQELNLIDELSVMENLFVGNEPVTRKKTIDWRAMEQRSFEILEKLGLDLDPHQIVRRLPMSLKQMIEIAKALVFEAQIIVMDEPTSSLTEGEAEILFKLIKNLKSHGKGIIYISHRMEEIFELSDRITVLRNGSYIATKDTSSTNHDELVALMIGGDPGQHFHKDESLRKDVVLDIRNLSGHDLVKDITLQVRAGEILGIAGLVGAGRTELLETVFGIYPPRKGEISFLGKPFKPSSPRASIKAGIAYVPEDRVAKGLFLDFDLYENIALVKSERDAIYGHTHLPKMRTEMNPVIGTMGIRTPSPRQQVKNLSGGNRQKVILARWVYAGMRVLLINEPTRGIDVGAKSEIYQLLKRLNREGVAIVMVSSDLSEIFGVSHRIAVMHEGRIVAVYDADQTDRQQVLSNMTGLIHSKV